MPPSQLPLDNFPAWAGLNDIHFDKVAIQEIQGKGLGLAAVSDLSSNGNGNDRSVLLRIPRELVLSGDAVDEYAKVDHNFQQLLQAIAPRTPRMKILLYLITHLVLSERDATSRGGVPTPWTDYTRFLPRYIPMPTMWSSDERQMLHGTSLEAALGAKLAVLGKEFDNLREKSSELPHWQDLFWEKEGVDLHYWVLVDAWYRSRCLEMPQAGNSMVPALDMVNHSHDPTAYYEEDGDGGVCLLLRPGHTVSSGSEITISYGEKPAAEMLFSYGFIDANTTKHELTLQIEPFPDDPLAKAKLHVFDQPPVVKLSLIDGSYVWESPFTFLMCLNEEDGLEFRVIQDNEGDRQLQVAWQGDDVTSRVHEFESLIRGHPLCQLFRLRVVAVLHELVTSQAEALASNADTADQMETDQIQYAKALRDVEQKILHETAEMLDRQVRPPTCSVSHAYFPVAAPSLP
ncbi:hypothetical protein B0I35DRAFT_128009 [Stachybotrys elegans]|uniref:SET domain-containing protein n=1 Tax=Stachybotrys elegans TaxID=80388 RepID=A0A8K0SVX6_9HYPO|nr:hypothetical protein B0I35DRAFT_128009 [Stachybotrys elegans]